MKAENKNKKRGILFSKEGHKIIALFVILIMLATLVFDSYFMNKMYSFGETINQAVTVEFVPMNAQDIQMGEEGAMKLSTSVSATTNGTATVEIKLPTGVEQYMTDFQNGNTLTVAAGIEIKLIKPGETYQVKGQTITATQPLLFYTLAQGQAISQQVIRFKYPNGISGNPNTDKTQATTEIKTEPIVSKTVFVSSGGSTEETMPPVTPVVVPTALPEAKVQEAPTAAPDVKTEESSNEGQVSPHITPEVPAAVPPEVPAAVPPEVPAAVPPEVPAAVPTNLAVTPDDIKVTLSDGFSGNVTMQGGTLKFVASFNWDNVSLGVDKSTTLATTAKNIGDDLVYTMSNVSQNSPNGHIFTRDLVMTDTLTLPDNTHLLAGTPTFNKVSAGNWEIKIGNVVAGSVVFQDDNVKLTKTLENITKTDKTLTFSYRQTAIGNDAEMTNPSNIKFTLKKEAVVVEDLGLVTGTQEITNKVDFVATPYIAVNNAVSTKTVVTQILPQGSDFSITKTSNKSYNTNSEMILDYTITIKNIGGVNLTNIGVTDTVPTNLVRILNNDGATVQPNGNLGQTTLLWSISNLPVGSSVEKHIQVVVKDTTDLWTEIINSATATLNGVEKSAIVTNQYVPKEPKMNFYKSAKETRQLLDGESQKYEFKFRNYGGTATDYVIEDQLPEYVTNPRDFKITTENGTETALNPSNYTIANNKITINGNIGVEEWINITFVVTIKDGTYDKLKTLGLSSFNNTGTIKYASKEDSSVATTNVRAREYKLALDKTGTGEYGEVDIVQLTNNRTAQFDSYKMDYILQVYNTQDALYESDNVVITDIMSGGLQPFAPLDNPTKDSIPKSGTIEGTLNPTTKIVGNWTASATSDINGAYTYTIKWKLPAIAEYSNLKITYSAYTDMWTFGPGNTLGQISISNSAQILDQQVITVGGILTPKINISKTIESLNGEPIQDNKRCNIENKNKIVYKLTVSNTGTREAVVDITDQLPGCFKTNTGFKWSIGENLTYTDGFGAIDGGLHANGKDVASDVKPTISWKSVKVGAGKTLTAYITLTFPEYSKFVDAFMDNKKPVPAYNKMIVDLQEINADGNGNKTWNDQVSHIIMPTILSLKKTADNSLPYKGGEVAKFTLSDFGSKSAVNNVTLTDNLNDVNRLFEYKELQTGKYNVVWTDTAKNTYQIVFTDSTGKAKTFNENPTVSRTILLSDVVGSSVDMLKDIQTVKWDFGNVEKLLIEGNPTLSMTAKNNVFGKPSNIAQLSYNDTVLSKSTTVQVVSQNAIVKRAIAPNGEEADNIKNPLKAGDKVKFLIEFANTMGADLSINATNPLTDTLTTKSIEAGNYNVNYAIRNANGNKVYDNTLSPTMINVTDSDIASNKAKKTEFTLAKPLKAGEKITIEYQLVLSEKFNQSQLGKNSGDDIDWDTKNGTVNTDPNNSLMLHNRIYVMQDGNTLIDSTGFYYKEGENKLVFFNSVLGLGSLTRDADKYGVYTSDQPIQLNQDHKSFEIGDSKKISDLSIWDESFTQTIRPGTGGDGYVATKDYIRYGLIIANDPYSAEDMTIDNILQSLPSGAYRGIVGKFGGTISLDNFFQLYQTDNLLDMCKGGVGNRPIGEWNQTTVNNVNTSFNNKMFGIPSNIKFADNLSLRIDSPQGAPSFKALKNDGTSFVLKPGEAIVIGYGCAVNRAGADPDVWNNTATLNIGATKKPFTLNSKDGYTSVIGDQVSPTVKHNDGTAQKLTDTSFSSSVNIYPPNLKAGIEKSATSAKIGNWSNATTIDQVNSAVGTSLNDLTFMDAVQWDVSLINKSAKASGNIDIVDYIPYPYKVITGTDATGTIVGYDQNGKEVYGTVENIANAKFGGSNQKVTFTNVSAEANSTKKIKLFTRYDSEIWLTNNYKNKAQFTVTNSDFALTAGQPIYDNNGKVIGGSAEATVYPKASHNVLSVKSISDGLNIGMGDNPNSNKVMVNSNGDKIAYTLSITNNGTKDYNNLVVIDKLPRVGDTGVINASMARESAFGVRLSDDDGSSKMLANGTVLEYQIVPNDGVESAAPWTAMSDFKVSSTIANDGYSQATWNYGDTGLTDWGAYNSVNAENYNALRCQIPSLKAGEKLNIRFTAKAGISGSLGNPGEIAWNTFGFAFNSTDGTNTEKRYYAEPAKVGVEIGQTQVTGTKTWIDGSNASNLRPDAITLQLKKIVGETTSVVSGATPLWTKNGDIWTYTYEGLPTKENGTTITYSVIESPVAGYSSAQSGLNFINTLTRDFSGTKTWLDNNDLHKLRPTEITLILKKSVKGETPAEVAGVTPTWTKNGNKWQYSYLNLPAYDANNNKISYTISETPVTNYKTSILGADITNVLTGKTKVNVLKNWSDRDNLSKSRPSSITVILNGNGIERQRVELNEGNHWTYNFTGLEKYDENGETIVYTVAEISVPGYESSIATQNGQFVISNTLQIGAIQIEKIVKSANSKIPIDTNKAFTFTVALTNSEGTPITGTYSYYSTNNLNTPKGTIGHNGTVTLKHGESIIIKNLPAGTNYTVTETPVDGYNLVAVGNSGVIKSDKIEYAAIAKFTNTYTTTSTSFQLNGHKNLTGRNLKADEFEFAIKDSAGNPVNDNSGQPIVVKNQLNGNIVFPSIEITSPGTYKYYVSEVYDKTKALYGVTYDDTVHEVTVVVTDNGNGGLVNTVTLPTSGLVYNNVYKIVLAKVDIQGNKVLLADSSLTGATIDKYTFNFEVVDSLGNVVATGTNDNTGKINFTSINLDKAGTFSYTVREKKGNIPGIIYTSSQYKVDVNVVDNNGVFSANISYPNGAITFSNTYAAKGSITLDAKKTLVDNSGSGKTLSDKQFSFKLKDVTTSQASYEQTVTNGADGKIYFDPITYATAGVFKYTMSETSTDSNGISCDKSIYNITVTVTDNGQGVLTPVAKYTKTTGNTTTAEASYPVNGLEFVNNYNATGSINLTATKRLVDNSVSAKALTDGQFSFKLKDVTDAASPKDVETATNNADGSIQFSAIQYTKAGTYKYTIEEVQTVSSGITYDTAKYNVTVVVTDNNNGQLTTASTYTKDGTTTSVNSVEFTNHYNANGSITLNAKKTLVNNSGSAKALADGQFSFKLTDVTIPASPTDVETVSNTADGSIPFKAIAYTKAGTYKYTMSETSTDGNGITCDKSIYNIIVTVTDDGHGALTPVAKYTKTTGTSTTTEASYPADGLAFVNNYNATGALTLGAKKTLTDGDGAAKALTANQFQFKLVELTSPDTVLQTVGNDATGKISFTEIPYTKAGTYNYKISEEINNINGITCDDTVYNIKVVVADDGNGTLTPTVTYKKNAAGTEVAYTQESIVFNNKYASTGTATFKVTKKINPSDVLKDVINLLKGTTLKNNQFTFTLTDVTDSANPNLLQTVDNTIDGNVPFTAITYDKAGTYNYKIDETSTDKEGIICDTTVYDIKVVVTDNGDGTLNTTTTYQGGTATADTQYPVDGLIFNNTYTATKTSATITATKELANKTLTNGQFSFELYENNVLKDTVNNVGKNITFKAIDYDKPGTHIYTIKEKIPTPKDDNITYDIRVVTVTVTVQDDGLGKLTATTVYDPIGGAVFKNTYTDPITLKLTGTKELTGMDLKANAFNFQVKEGENVVATGTNKADKSIDFSLLTYGLKDVGTHTYTVSEVTGNVGGMTYDTRVFNVSVVVTNTGGVLTAVPTYTNGNIVFNNSYDATGTSIKLLGTKVLTGGDLKEHIFKFEVKENGTKVADGTSEANGNINFNPINYKLKDVGTHTYTVTEVNENKVGIIYDSSSYTVTVNVVDNQNGTISATATYPTGTDKLTFNNNYNATGSINLTATKTLVDNAGTAKALTDGQFSFKLTDVTDSASPKEVETATNNVAGNIPFKAIGYTKAGTYKYTIEEVQGASSGITYDTAKYNVTVVVTDNNNGQLTTAATYTKDGTTTSVNSVEFTNHYNANGSITLNAKKTLVNNSGSAKALADGQFSFKLTDVTIPASPKDVETVSNTADGSIPFKAIAYTKAGTYKYTMSETSTDGNGITCDKSIYNITVTVTDNGQGVLTPVAMYTKTTGASATTEASYPTDGLAFVNNYNATGALTLSAKKTLTDGDGAAKALTANQFQFKLVELTSPEKVLQTVGNDATGKISFTEITYTQAGTYNYTISEDINNTKGITCDDTVYNIKVVVSDNGNGILTPTVTYKKNAAGTEVAYTPESIVFNNKYAATGTATFKVTKKINPSDVLKDVINLLKGTTLKDNQFTFTLTDVTDPANAKLLQTVNNTIDGNVPFTAITYDKAGTYNYKIDETSTDKDGIACDTTVYAIKVVVTDNGDGTLNTTTTYQGGTATADTQYPVDGLIFNNTYTATKTSATITATKELANKTLTDGQFSFELYENNVLKDTVNNVGKNITFKAIDYDKPGTHIYTIKEKIPTTKDDNITYDISVFTVTVTVQDDGLGKLTATTVYDPIGGAVFKNIYTLDGISINFVGSKVLKDPSEQALSLIGRQFKFTVMEDVNQVATGTSDDTGKITFTPITYELKDIGTHTYTVKEVDDKAGGMTYDTTIFNVNVDITNDNGVLKATTTYTKSGTTVSSMEFNNKYTTTDTSVILEATKKIDGENNIEGTKLKDKQFSFELVGVGNEPTTAVIAQNDVSGKIAFPEIKYAKAGEYNYKLTEKVDDTKGITCDKSIYNIKVVVKDDGKGTLTNKVTYAKNTDTSYVEYLPTSIVFNNKYAATGTVTFKVMKKINPSEALKDALNLKGTKLKDNQFTFILTDVTDTANAKLLQTIQNTANGNVPFTAITYDKAGTYNYKIDETSIDKGGITCDTTVYAIKVVVTDNGDGTLKTTTTYQGGTVTVDTAYPVDGLVFNNTYATTNTSATITATKELANKTLTDGQFSFELYENNVLKDTVNNVGENITFKAIDYDKPGLYQYTIKETAGIDPKMQYDPSVLNVTVNVVDNGDGTLTATTVYDPIGGAVFKNTYTPDPITLQLDGTKHLDGADLKHHTFTFKVMEGNKEVATGTNNAQGKITFTPITYELKDVRTHNYKVTEVKGTNNGMTYDTTVFDVSVEVTNIDGVLKATPINPPAIVFNNNYTTDGSNDKSIQLEGTKTLTGADLKDNKFKFEIKEKGVKVADGISDDKGVINFGLINYEHKDIGTHVYTITEVNEHKTGITYDTTSYQVTVDVEDNHDGTIKITPHYPNGGVVFKNTYTTPSVDSAFIKLVGTKQLVGENLSGYKFKFQVKEDNKVICTGESDASGHIEFPYIFYYFTGTHNYEISEIIDGQQWIDYDKKIYPVTVTVKYGNYGFLTAEAKYQGSDKAATFVNGYNGPKAEVSIAGTKKMIGANLKSGQFEFALSSKGKVIDTATNKKDGTFAFDTIVYEKPGIYFYSIEEKNEKLEGIVYDRNKFGIKVTVTEAKNGELTATKEYQNGDIVFRNVKINSEKGDTNDTNDPQTGDNQPIGLWLAFGGDALALLILILIRRRIKEEGEI